MTRSQRHPMASKKNLAVGPDSTSHHSKNGIARSNLTKKKKKTKHSIEQKIRQANKNVEPSSYSKLISHHTRPFPLCIRFMSYTFRGPFSYSGSCIGPQSPWSFKLQLLPSRWSIGAIMFSLTNSSIVCNFLTPSFTFPLLENPC